MGSLTLKQFQSPLLAPIDLHLAAGECLAISGPSGSGKSRLLRALADLDPAEGGIQLDGRDRLQFSGPEWRLKVGLLTAESGWWSERVGDHFEQVDETLFSQLDLTLKCLDWEVSHLSSGERQRLSLIRLLSQQPEVLLLDEPTANLDQRNTERVESLIGDWRRNHHTAVLWVSHDPEQRARIAAQAWHIDAGELRPEA
ncbi:MAG: ATP-binding cassette domain-containing protein [Candidatus Thiodiazotropha sp.]